MIFATIVFSKFCTSQNVVCYTINKSNNTLNVYIDSKTSGWVGFGVGEDMIGDIVVAWPNKDKVVVSNRIGEGKRLPEHKDNANLRVVSSKVTESGFQLNLTRPLTATDGFTASATTKYMAAYNKNEIESSKVDTDFPPHTYRMNFEDASNASNGTSTNSQDTETSEDQSSHALKYFPLLFVQLISFY